MSSAPLTPGLYPGSNTSGFNIAVPYAPQGGGQASLGGAINPFLPSSVGTGTSMPMLPQGAVSNTATSGFPANFGGYTPTVPGSTSTAGPVPSQGSVSSGAIAPTGTGAGLGVPTTQGGENKLLQTLNKTYGAGLGTMLYNFMAGGAGFNQDAINNLIAAMQPGFERGQQDLLSSFSAGGNRFSSGAQIGLADLLSNQQLDVGQLESQMYEQSVNNMINVMMGAGGSSAQRKLQQGSGGFLSGLLGSGGISSILGGISDKFGVGGAGGSILDILGSTGL